MAAIAGVSFAGSGAVSAAQGYRCQATVDAKLTEHGISADKVKRQKILNSRTGGEAKIIIGHSVWTALHGCKGYVVIDIDLSCNVEQAYVHGQCNVPGLKNF